MASSAQSPVSDAAGSESRPPSTRMTGARTLLFAVAGGAAVGNLYWAQPLLEEIASSLGVPAAVAGLLVTVTQVGYAVGIFLLVPLGDLLNRRRLIPAVLAASGLALAGAAVAPTLGGAVRGAAAGRSDRRRRPAAHPAGQ